MTLAGWIQRYRRWKLRSRGLRVDRTCKVGSLVSLGDHPPRHPPGAIEVGPHCELGQGVELMPWGGSIRIGSNVFVGPYCVIYGHGGVTIGDHTLIAMHCAIVSSNHTVPGRERTIRSQPDELLPVHVGRDVWLGAGVKVLGGVTIGDGCVIGAGAVVSTDLPPYSIAMGIPARVVRSRE